MFAKPALISMKVTVRHIYISPDHNYFGRYGKGSLDHATIEQDTVELVAGSGIVNDRFFNFKEDYKGQITFFDWAIYQKVVSEVASKEIQPSTFRRNVILEGVDLNTLIGKRFSINGVEYTGSGECSPCFWMDEACGDGTEDFLKGRGGLRCRILTDGSLALGDYELTILGDA